MVAHNDEYFNDGPHVFGDWIFDSGASAHMTSNQAWLKIMNPSHAL